MPDGDHQPEELRSLLGDDPASSPSAAWQPFTPRGIAAFAEAGQGRAVLVSSCVAAFMAASICWFFHVTFEPALQQAALKLPETGAIENQRLTLPQPVGPILVEDRVWGMGVDLDGREFPTLASDFQIILQERFLRVCSLLGCWSVDYPPGWIIEVNRQEWESGIQAWKPMVLGMLFLVAFTCLMILWHALATLYFLVPWLVSYYSDRRLTLAGSWRLSLAALLPGALLLTGGVWLYAMGGIDLVRFSMLAVLHLLISWLFLMLAVRSLPKVTDPVSAAKPNPFGPPPPAAPQSETSSPGPPRNKNPFAPVSPPRDPRL